MIDDDVLKRLGAPMPDEHYDTIQLDPEPKRLDSVLMEEGKEYCQLSPYWQARLKNIKENLERDNRLNDILINIGVARRSKKE